MATYYSTHDAAGGGAGTFGDPFTLQELLDTCTAGDEGRVLNTGTYTPSAKLDVDTNSGTTTSPIRFRGRNSGDSAYELVTISGSSLPATTDLMEVDGDVNRFLRFHDIRLTAATRHNFWVDHKDNAYVNFYNCRFDNAANSGIVFGNQFSLYYCEIDSNGATGGVHVVSNGGTNLQVIGCSVHDNSGHGIENNSGGGLYFGNLFYDNTVDGLRTENGGNIYVLNNTFHANDGDGWSPDGNMAQTVCLNNIFANNGAYGINAPASQAYYGVLWDFNCFYSNTSGETDLAATPGDNNVSSDPKFISVVDGSEDYNIQSDSPCKAAGFPGTVGISSTTSGVMDIGAFQINNKTGYKPFGRA